MSSGRKKGARHTRNVSQDHGSGLRIPLKEDDSEGILQAVLHTAFYCRTVAESTTGRKAPLGNGHLMDSSHCLTGTTSDRDGQEINGPVHY